MSGIRDFEPTDMWGIREENAADSLIRIDCTPCSFIDAIRKESGVFLMY